MKKQNMNCPLSPRELEVLELLQRGLMVKEIADELGISDETVRTHKDNIKRKLNALNVAHAVAIAIHKGWLTDFT